MSLSVRRAAMADARPIAAIHVHAWQSAYQGIVPAGVLSGLSIDAREAVWRQHLEHGASETLVAEQDEQIVGWLSAGRSRDAEAAATTGEVWAIYVDPPHWRQGVGRRLWREAEQHLAASGFSEVTLWVLKENAPAIAFYESLGLSVDTGSEKTIAQGGAELIEVRLRKRLTG